MLIVLQRILITKFGLGHCYFLSIFAFSFLVTFQSLLGKFRPQTPRHHLKRKQLSSQSQTYKLLFLEQYRKWKQFNWKCFSCKKAGLCKWKWKWEWTKGGPKLVGQIREDIFSAGPLVGPSGPVHMLKYALPTALSFCSHLFPWNDMACLPRNCTHSKALYK